MRVLLWILGAAATVTGALYAARRKERRVADAFLKAVQDGHIDRVHDAPVIGGGFRGGVINGLADGTDFCLVMRTDRADGVIRLYDLAWDGHGSARGTFNPLKDSHVKALAEAYEMLARLCGRAHDPPN
jgi:hypothetical protein